MLIEEYYTGQKSLEDFSQRGKDRPNTIGMTSVEIVSVDEKSITVKGLDAIDGMGYEVDGTLFLI